MIDPKDILTIAPEVAAALAAKQPVVALESTVISHGLPWPQNLELAREVEALVRDNGAIPATIALLHGRVCVGLDQAALQHLATSQEVAKVSMRDIAIVLARRAAGATTVATTMWAAHLAGISVFATGGIGGIHRGDGSDISADLPALASIPVAVVCSGAKAILDLPRTREWLETWGVPVLGWQSQWLPAFYSRSSGLSADLSVANAADAAAIVRQHLALNRTGLLLGVPVPEGEEIAAELAEGYIAQADTEAHQAGISGAATTPFLLKRLGEISNGATLRANLALLRNNARVAAQMAAALSELR
jgi:pseudouridine-5'-phosphate glycosidase